MSVNTETQLIILQIISDHWMFNLNKISMSQTLSSKMSIRKEKKEILKALGKQEDRCKILCSGCDSTAVPLAHNSYNCLSEIKSINIPAWKIRVQSSGSSSPSWGRLAPNGFWGNNLFSSGLYALLSTHTPMLHLLKIYLRSHKNTSAFQTIYQENT